MVEPSGDSCASLKERCSSDSVVEMAPMVRNPVPSGRMAYSPMSDDPAFGWPVKISSPPSAGA